MSSANVKIIGLDGNFKEVRKIAFFADQDQDGTVFFKAEAQCDNQRAALAINYDKAEAIYEFACLLEKILVLQESKLQVKDSY